MLISVRLLMVSAILVSSAKMKRTLGLLAALLLVRVAAVCSRSLQVHHTQKFESEASLTALGSRVPGQTCLIKNLFIVRWAGYSPTVSNLISRSILQICQMRAVSVLIFSSRHISIPHPPIPTNRLS